MYICIKFLKYAVLFLADFEPKPLASDLLIKKLCNIVNAHKLCVNTIGSGLSLTVRHNKEPTRYIIKKIKSHKKLNSMSPIRAIMLYSPRSCADRKVKKITRRQKPKQKIKYDLVPIYFQNLFKWV